MPLIRQPIDLDFDLGRRNRAPSTETATLLATHAAQKGPAAAAAAAPFFCTTLRGRTSTSRLRSLRSSGLMIFFLFFSCSSLVCVRFCCCRDEPCGGEEEDDDDGSGSGSVRGAGKFCFLSMASTRRLKRRKSASARMSVDSRSIVLESSLTIFESDSR